MHKKTLFVALVAAVFAGGFSLSATASPAKDSGATAQQSQQKATLSDAELKKVAATYEDMKAIRMKYAPKVKGAANKAEAQKIAHKARKQMKAAIKDHGYTLASYTKAVRTINSSPELKKRFKELTQDGK